MRSSETEQGRQGVGRLGKGGIDDGHDEAGRGDDELVVIVEVELRGRNEMLNESASRFWSLAMKRGMHLEYVVTHFKHDRLLHPVVLDQKVHVLLALDVLEQPCDVATESLGHVVFEILQEVRLAVEFGRLDRERVMPPRVDVVSAVRDVVKVPAVRFCESVQGHPPHPREGGTHSLSGESTMVVESLKYNPAVPSVKLYAVPYLCV